MFETRSATTRSPRGRSALAIVFGATLLAATVAAAPASAASVPAHSGTFSCNYNQSGQRVITANMPKVFSFRSLGEQVFWYAEVWKKTSAGLTYVGNTRSRLSTAWANTRGISGGALVPGGEWVEEGTNNIVIHGGKLAVSSPGTYQVVGRFWWLSFSTGYTGTFATNYDYPTYDACYFPS